MKLVTRLEVAGYVANKVKKERAQTYSPNEVFQLPPLKWLKPDLN